MQTEQLLSTESIFEGKIIRVRVDTVRLPGGDQASREVVEHNDAVVVVAIDAEGNVVLVRQYRHAAGRSLLEAPAGVVEDGEAPEACAQRELQEEIGYASRDMRGMGGFWSSPGFCTEFMHAYVAKDLVPRSLEADADENIQIERVPLSNTSWLIRQGKIQDAKTIAALMMATCLSENA